MWWVVVVVEVARAKGHLGHQGPGQICKHNAVVDASVAVPKILVVVGDPNLQSEMISVRNISRVRMISARNGKTVRTLPVRNIKTVRTVSVQNIKISKQ